MFSHTSSSGIRKRGQEPTNRDEAKNHMQDARDPNELLGEHPREPDIPIPQHERNNKTENKQHNRVGVEPEVVAAAVDPPAIEAVRRRVTRDADPRDGNETREDG